MQGAWSLAQMRWTEIAFALPGGVWVGACAGVVRARARARVMVRGGRRITSPLCARAARADVWAFCWGIHTSSCAPQSRFPPGCVVSSSASPTNQRAPRRAWAQHATACVRKEPGLPGPPIPARPLPGPSSRRPCCHWLAAVDREAQEKSKIAASWGCSVSTVQMKQPWRQERDGDPRRLLTAEMPGAPLGQTGTLHC